MVLPSVAVAQEAHPDDLINALNDVFGKHAGKRAAHKILPMRSLDYAVSYGRRQSN